MRISEHTPIQNAPSRKLKDKAAPSDAGTPQRNPPTRKRSRPPIESIATCTDAPVSKRPRRLRMETRKAREAREAKEAFASSDSRNKKRPVHADPPHRRDEGDGRVADIEDVYLGKDGSIQCVVRWKSSLVPRDNLVGEELHKRCEEVFKKKYGTQEWKKRLKKRLAKRLPATG